MNYRKALRARRVWRVAGPEREPMEWQELTTENNDDFTLSSTVLMTVCRAVCQLVAVHYGVYSVSAEH
jgi:hypothetical protein